MTITAETRSVTLFYNGRPSSADTPASKPHTQHKSLFDKHLQLCKYKYYITMTPRGIKCRNTDIYAQAPSRRQKHPFVRLDNFYEICKRFQAKHRKTLS